MTKLPNMGARGRRWLPARSLYGWLAAWAQARRRGRQQHLLPAPLLRPVYGGLLAWDWSLPDPARWNVWESLNGGVSYVFAGEYWAPGSDRQFAPDGGSEWYVIVGVDANGVEITQRSNAVRPDDAPAPVVNSPVITSGGFGWDLTTPGAADVWINWTFDHGALAVAILDLQVSVDGGDYALVASIASNLATYTLPALVTNEASCQFVLRYRNGPTVGPFSNAYPVEVQF